MKAKKQGFIVNHISLGSLYKSILSISSNKFLLQARRGGTVKQADLNSSLPVTSITNRTRQSKPNLNTTLQPVRNHVPAADAAAGKVAVKKGQGKAASRNRKEFPLSKQPAQSSCGPTSRQAPTVSLPRPVLPRERGYIDKFVGFLVSNNLLQGKEGLKK